MKMLQRRTKVSNPGKYRHYGAVKSSTKTSDGRLGFTSTAATACNGYFSITPFTGREKLIADQLQSKVSHILRTPYRSTWQTDFASERYIVIDSRNFYIKAAMNRNEENMEVEIFCEEKV